jgi:(2R)-3-sulfolactate dehydrogenase (NADP+)
VSGTSREDPVVFSVSEIERLAFRALEANGASERQAGSLAQAIAAAERDGIRSHGLMYLATYCEHLRCGKVDGQATPILERAAPAVTVVDAMTGFAHSAIDLGLEALIPAAREEGVALLAIRNSYNCGVLGYHTERIARQDLVGLGFTNAPASIAPWGALKPVLGTNPWSVAAPDGRGGAVFVIDQSASVVAKSEVMKKAKAGEPIPPGWALDQDGRPTTDGAAALRGTMMPSGGAKGVGAALLVELMAACLTGATPGLQASPFSGPLGGPPRTGQLFIAIDPRRTAGGAFVDRLATVAEAFAAEPGSRLPGMRRFSARADAERKGVPVAPDLLERARQLAAASQAQQAHAG